MKLKFNKAALTLIFFVCSISLVYAPPNIPTPPPNTPVPINSWLFVFEILAVFIAFYKIYKNKQRKTN